MVYVVLSFETYDIEGRRTSDGGVVAVCDSQQAAEEARNKAVAEDSFGRKEYDYEIVPMSA